MDLNHYETPREESPHFVNLLIVALAYFITAKLGLMLDAVSGFATLVWPPAGIALAIVLLYGRRYWPGIFLGAFAVNLATGAPLLVAAGIGVGNTLAAVVGYELLRRFTDFHNTLDRLKDVIAFIILACALSTLISATVGTTCLWLGKVKSLEGFGITWQAWWVGDALGDLITAPLVLVWLGSRFKPRFDFFHLFEALVLTVALISAGVLIAHETTRLQFWYFPFVVWGALRFGQIGNVTVVFVISALSLWGFAHGAGQLAHGTLRFALFLLDSFMVVIAGTGMTLAALLSEKLKATQAIRMEEIQKDALLSTSQDGVISVDHLGKIREFNPAAERIFGIERNEILGQDVNQIVKLPKKISEYSTLNDDPSLKILETTATRNDGTLFPVELTLTKIPLDPPMFTGYIRDVSKQKEVEGIVKQSHAELEKWVQDQTIDLKKSEERFRLMVEGVKDYAIYLLDPEGKVMTWNLGAELLIGYRADEIIGRNFSIFYPQEDVKAGKPTRELKEAQILGRFEDIGWRVRKDGAQVWADVVITVLKDSQGEVRGYSKVAKDLTQQKLAEERLKQENKKLEERVRERTGELALAVQKLQISDSGLREAIKVRDHFLSIASHELKTPITSLSLQIQMARLKINPEKNIAPSAEKLAKVFEISENQIKRLTDLVEELLDVARIQSGKFSFKFEETNLSENIKEILDQFSYLLAKAACPLKVEIEDGIIGYFDRSRVEQVVDNLLVNAAKYAPGGPVKLSLAKHGQVVSLKVQDSGPGIPEDRRSKIFDRFERATSSDGVGGLGLGLFIVREIAKGHGGSVRLETSSERGSIFVVELPITGPRPETDQVREVDHGA